MKNRQRRVRAIGLSLTPQQVVMVWLRDAAHAGTFEEGARHLPPYRSAVANTVLRTVRNSMKGQAEQLIERAVLQARREADLLYNLVVNANTAVLEGRVERERARRRDGGRTYGHSRPGRPRGLGMGWDAAGRWE